MVRSLLIRGMIVGLVAGFLVFAIGRIFGEPQVDHAIAFETAMDTAKTNAAILAGHPIQAPDPELVSRPVQASWGLLTGVVVYGTAFGGLFALVFAFVHGRLGAGSPRMISLMIALCGLVAVFIVPDLKYPSNPPAVGQPDTITIRTEAYFVMMICSIGALVGAIGLRQHLTGSRGVWSASMIGASFYILFVSVIMLMLPVVQEVPPGFDAVVLWRFRVVTIAMQVVMWTTLGLGFGTLAEQLINGKPRFARGSRVLTGMR